MPAKHYAITRINAAKNAWNWAVHLKRRGQLHTRNFAHLQYGGRGKALAAALAWRDEVARGAVFSVRELIRK